MQNGPQQNPTTRALEVHQTRLDRAGPRALNVLQGGACGSQGCKDALRQICGMDQRKDNHLGEMIPSPNTGTAQRQFAQW